MEIRGNNYKVWDDANTATVSLEGILRLGTAEAYQPLLDLILAQIAPLAVGAGKLKLDLYAVNFLDDAGFDVLCKAAIAVRKKAGTLVVRGNRNVPWQSSKLPTLKSFAQSFEITLAD